MSARWLVEVPIEASGTLRLLLPSRRRFLRWDGSGGVQTAIICHEIWKTQAMNNNGKTQDELDLLNAIREALERRDEVFQIIDEAPDEPTAIVRLAELLGVEDHLCHGILNLQVKNWLGTQRERVEEGITRLHAALERGQPRS